MIYLQLRVKMADEDLETFLTAIRLWNHPRQPAEFSIILETPGVHTDEDLKRIFAGLPYRRIEHWPDTPEDLT
jgi:hypothetical protein